MCPGTGRFRAQPTPAHTLHWRVWAGSPHRVWHTLEAIPVHTIQSIPVRSTDWRVRTGSTSPYRTTQLLTRSRVEARRDGGHGERLTVSPPPFIDRWTPCGGPPPLHGGRRWQRPGDQTLVSDQCSGPERRQGRGERGRGQGSPARGRGQGTIFREISGGPAAIPSLSPHIAWENTLRDLS